MSEGRPVLGKVLMKCRWCGREVRVVVWRDGSKTWGMCPWCRTYGEVETENRPMSERRKG